MSEKSLNFNIAPADEAAKRRAIDRWNGVAKPIGSLGVFEDIVVQIAGLTGEEDVRLDKRAVLAMCADNGVVEEGVTQTGQEITSLVAGNMLKKISSVCVMGSVANIDVVPVDVGMATKVEGVADFSTSRGTANFTKGPAMTREQAIHAINAGVEMVGRLRDEGCNIIVAAEMGIGNTTSSSAVASVLLDKPVEVVTGKGAGLSNEGLQRKVAAIRKTIALNQPDPSDALDVLAKVGGFDIAGMAGTFIGGAIHRVPVVIDGFISAVAALIALRICPECRLAIIPSHMSEEPASRLIFDELGMSPIINAGLRLGEGTGAVLLLPMFDMALALYRGKSFGDIGMDAYEVDL